MHEEEILTDDNLGKAFKEEQPVVKFSKKEKKSKKQKSRNMKNRQPRIA